MHKSINNCLTIAHAPVITSAKALVVAYKQNIIIQKHGTQDLQTEEMLKRL